ncbi:hypothetical protein PybrP1_004962 [[Pythium] brassicae (nom. inval.)]|nr:hypothetical protein PybrP1_004962 [[Pythium] brassicae (nom. inval.)]
MMAMSATRRPFELIIQDEYLIVRRAELTQQLLLLPRTNATNDASLGASEESAASFPHVHGRRMSFDAIYGVFWLLRGPYLALVTESRSAAKGVGGSDIRLVQQLELMLIPTQNLPVLTPAQEEDEVNSLVLIPRVQTCSGISAFDASSGSIAERADRRFCWNYPICTEFLEKKLFEWITPMVQAYVEVTDEIKVNEAAFRILYVSRRSCKRQGTRFTMRGIDAEGNVANFVETEQICLFADGRQTSFVQIRGSIPVFWSSPVTMKYAPTVYQRAVPETDIAAFKLHAYELMALYGRVLVVNLIDKKKEQLKLGEAMAKTIADAATQDSHVLANVRFVWFDFHHECSKMRWSNLEKLIKQVDDDFQDYGFFCKSADGHVVSTQSGVVRTNCMDNLDRTNVVQSLFGRRSLLLQINETAALKGDVLSSPFATLEPVFKGVWGNNADAISYFYAGTGALKTDFTRTGKRTNKGAAMDGVNSCIRYVTNNFMDGYRQDVVDLLLGRYVVSRSKSSPFRQEREDSESLESLLAKLLGVVVLFFLVESLRGSGQAFVLERLLRAVVWTLLLCAAVFSLLLKKGNTLGQKLVQLPCLRPQDGCMTSWKN